MIKVQKIVTIGGTIASALAIGYFMQRGEPPVAHHPKLAPEPIQQAELAPFQFKPVAPVADLAVADLAEAVEPAEPGKPDETAETEPVVQPVDIAEVAAPATSEMAPEADETADADQPELRVEDIALASADIPATTEDFDHMLAGTVASGPDKPVTAPDDPETPRLGCNVISKAVPAGKAMVELTIDAPCNPNERVAIHHTGMIFTETTDENGFLALDVPAMTAAAVFVAEFDSGRGGVATAQVPGLKDFDRVALQWKGVSGFQIHAREYGAAYGSAGHVWSGHATSERENVSGFMTRLGDAGTLYPNLVEVYTFPSGQADQSGTVSLTVEAEVTDVNCGRDIAAQSIELRAGGTLKTQDLVLSMPDCSAKGDFLVLNNLVDDLKIAEN